MTRRSQAHSLSRIALLGIALHAPVVAFGQGHVMPVSSAAPVPVTESFVAPRGARVRWGGVIERIENQGSRLILQVRGHPLDARGRPRTTIVSGGHFLVVASNQVDAAAYAPQRIVTVTGRVLAEVLATRNGYPLRLPVVRAELRELWPGRPAPAVAHEGGAGAGPVYGSYSRPRPYADPLLVLGSIALVGAVLAADSGYVGIGFGHYPHYGYGHGGYYHHRRHGYGRHRWRAHYGVSAGFRF